MTGLTGGLVTAFELAVCQVRADRFGTAGMSARLPVPGQRPGGTQPDRRIAQFRVDLCGVDDGIPPLVQGDLLGQQAGANTVPGARDPVHDQRPRESLSAGSDAQTLTTWLLLEAASLVQVPARCEETSPAKTRRALRA